MGFAQTHKGLLEEKQRFATGSCNATALPVTARTLTKGDFTPYFFIVQILV